ncbi:hypothetical protein [Pseudoxanthomonas koreensis]|uniref:hypothetical protein n=1 Tax=Pseudoxanthomonas koreensis TaxID=266061 RepID=UPI001390D9FB|nr:hypothetical protein [Pseudoxanthomonas koreensis]KAF1692648.1 hypothetical protein CSC64_06580 [Pseudoxanthomonas koreensis]
MSVHQLLNPFVALDNLLGTATAPGGKLYFYERGTTTPKDTWQDFGKGTSNANPVILDSAGRVPAQVWGDGDYSVKLDAADDSAIVASVEFRDPAPAGSAIPDQSGHSGEFLGTNGTDTAWLPVLQLPDPTGSAGYMPVVNGAGDGYALIPQPTAPESANIAVTSSRIVLTDADGNKWQIIRGTVTTSSGVGTMQAQGTVTYPNAFSETVWPVVTPTGGPFAPGNSYGPYYGDLSVTAANANGFTFIVNTAHADPGPASQEQISGNITASFIAMGPIA